MYQYRIRVNEEVLNVDSQTLCASPKSNCCECILIGIVSNKNCSSLRFCSLLFKSKYTHPNLQGKRMLDFIEKNSHFPAKYSVIWLHGLGADGHDFESIVPELDLSQELAVRFIFPHAP